MRKPSIIIASIAALAAALPLASCGRGSDDSELANLDNQIVGNETDPALTSALQDQILVDPTLSQQSNRNAVRSAQSPTQAQYPSGSQMGALRDGASGGCGAEFEYAMGWANRLPAAFSVYPGSQVTEAAANNANGCRMRVVTFTTAEAPQRLLDWYRGRAINAGYSAEQQARGGDQVLAGTNPADDGAFYLIVTPRGSGADVALITNNGR
jgi:hypothetical protein